MANINSDRTLPVFVVIFVKFVMCALAMAANRRGNGHLDDFRLVTYSDLLPEMKQFSYPGVTSYSEILFDVQRYQLLVGARDYLFRLELDGLRKLEDIEWSSRRNAVKMCKQKGQSSEDCHNYIRVLLSHKNQVLACGTNAFNPRCSWRPIDDLKTIKKMMNGVAKSPYSPHNNITTLMTKSGDYYFASVMDFSARDAAIYRIMGKSPIIRTVQYDSKWLNEPNFVGSFEIENFTYFFFRETAVEYMNCGKIIYSRVARICKNDVGGKFVLKENWTTFLKARLNCSIGGEYPFYFNEIQNIFYVEEAKTFYATFSTPQNSIYGTAVCSFNLSSINQAFNGPFKYQSDPKSTWQQHSSPHNHFQCNTPGNSEQLLDSSRYQLMDEAVQPSISRPIYMEELSRFSQIVADVVPTKHENMGVHVIFVATAEGIIKKLSVHPKTKATCLIEEIRPFHKDQSEKILVMKILKETNSLYIGTDKSVKRIRVHHCGRFKTRRACLNAKDPYCGWNSHMLACATAPHRNPLISFWHQDATSCPVLSDPIDGEWGDWSLWDDCLQRGSSLTGDRCKCRLRTCNSPSPMNGGQFCMGHSHEVTNCTRNGGWTNWSAWSACSQSCGVAIKTRRRSCGNPKPSFGGRICVGPERQEIFCPTNPPCPIPTPPKIDGQWSAFGPWQECSSKCGGGIQVRRRRCDSPAPKNGGAPCSGCNLEYLPCNSHTCQEVRRSSNWTPWMRHANSSTRNGFYQERHRFSCFAPVAESRMIRFGQIKSEERFCYKDGRGCTGSSDDADIDGGWSEWTKWSNCSRKCGGGVQQRNRKCSDPYPVGGGDDCEGANIEERSCNTKACQGSWSCWSAYSSCSVSCSSGIKKRTRNCTDAYNKDLPGVGCIGESVYIEACDGGPCYSLRGWDEWSVWSKCNANKEQIRRRVCKSNSIGLCRGPDKENRICVSVAYAGNMITSAAKQISSKDDFNIGHVIGGVIGGFIMGIITGGLLMRFYMKKNGNLRKEPKLENHFISAKDNHYVTNFEMQTKSPFSTLNGTLRKALPISAQSTLKKNAVYNSHIRAPYLDEPKNFEL